VKRLLGRSDRSLDGEAGLTLVELLVASAMGVVLMGVVGTMVVQTMKAQPELSKRSENITTARWVLERMTREIRNGERVDTALPNEVSFRTYVRRTECGKSGTLASTKPAILCEVTYGCSSTACSRIEAAPGVFTGKATPIFEGINNSNVFTYIPNVKSPTFIKITLHLPNPNGPSDLTISDGASLRNGILTN
jgi:type II secretory pathway pseudopilin PulG